MSSSNGEPDTRAGPEAGGHTRLPGTPGATRLLVESLRLCSPSPSSPGPVPRFVVVEALGRGEEQGGDRCGSPPSPGRRRAPRHPRLQPRGAEPRRRAHECTQTHAHTHGHQHTRALCPALPLGGDPPARRQLRLRHPACVYNFVLLPRPPCSWKGGEGMWKAAARRLTGGSSGGLRRWPERLSFAEVARPLLAVPPARAGLCVLPPRP